MNDEFTSVMYTQLNERSRYYGKHLWQVPFFYVAVIAWCIEKIPKLDPLGKEMSVFGLSLFSFSVLLFVTELKYYARRSVLDMQEVEKRQGEVVSSGGDEWYMTFAFYTRCMLTLGVLGLLAYDFLEDFFPYQYKYDVVARIAKILGFLTLIVIALIHDRRRSKPLIRNIRKNNGTAV